MPGYLHPRFRNDVFLSYRHAMDEGPTPWVKGWHEQLKYELNKLLGPVEIWMDKLNLRDGEQWRQAIREEEKAAAIFIALFSMTYMESDECRTELDNFLAFLEDDRRNKANGRRLIPVLVHPVQEGIPPEVKETQHTYAFFDPDPSSSTNFKEYRPDSQETREKFVDAIARLAQDLSRQIREIKGTPAEPPRGTVFLARVKPELSEVRDQLRADLVQRGYAVVPDHEYLWHSAELPGRLAADLDRAGLCVHVVSQTGSSDPEAVLHARLQLERAAAAMKARSLPAPLVWIRPAQEAARDPATVPLVDWIRTELANEGVEYWERSLEDFKSQVHERLPGARAAVADEVAVVSDDADLPATEALDAVLADRLKVQPRRLHFTSPAPRDPDSFARALERCSHAIVFWGAASEAFVSDVLGLPPIVEKAKAHKVCVYGAPPRTEEKQTFHSSRASLLLQSAAGVDEAQLRQFLGAGGSP